MQIFDIKVKLTGGDLECKTEVESFVWWTATLLAEASSLQLVLVFPLFSGKANYLQTNCLHPYCLTCLISDKTIASLERIPATTVKKHRPLWLKARINPLLGLLPSP
jgi:hypothetical protein